MKIVLKVIGLRKVQGSELKRFCWSKTFIRLTDVSPMVRSPKVYEDKFRMKNCGW